MKFRQLRNGGRRCGPHRQRLEPDQRQRRVFRLLDLRLLQRQPVTKKQRDRTGDHDMHRQ